MAGHVPDRRDPAVLAAAHRPGRRPGPRRTQDTALPDPAHRRETGPRRTPAAENPRDLAMGGRHRHRLGQDHRPATGPLTSSKPPLQHGKNNPGPVESPATGPAAGPPSYPDPKITNCSAAQPPSRASHASA